MMHMYYRIINNEIGHASIEYALIASIVSIVIIVSLFIIRAQLTAIFASIANAF